MAVRYADAGFAVVLDDFWDPPGLLEYRELPDDRPLHRVLLRPPREVALERNYGRHGEDPVRLYLDEGIELAYRLYDQSTRAARSGGLVRPRQHRPLTRRRGGPDRGGGRPQFGDGRGAMTHSARGRIEISSGVVPRSCESARQGSGWWLVISTFAARYVDTCGA